jgi:hypothetical protein
MFRNCVFGAYRASATKASSLSITSANPATIRICSFLLRGFGLLRSFAKNYSIKKVFIASMRKFLPRSGRSRCTKWVAPGMTTICTFGECTRSAERFLRSSARDQKSLSDARTNVGAVMRDASQSYRPVAR